MSEQSNRGAAEEASGSPDVAAEHTEPASSASTPGAADLHARGAAEEAAEAPVTAGETPADDPVI